MSVTAVAAAGTAVAVYLYGRRGAACSEPRREPAERETHAGLHSAPTTFLEDLFFLAEGLRWVEVRHMAQNTALAGQYADRVNRSSAQRPPRAARPPSGRRQQCAGASCVAAPGTALPRLCQGAVPHSIAPQVLLW